MDVKQDCLKHISEGNVLSYLYDTGAMGYTTAFVRVIKIGKRKIKVRFENGNERWKYPDYFTRIVSDKDVQELLDDGVNI